MQNVISHSLRADRHPRTSLRLDGLRVTPTIAGRPPYLTGETAVSVRAHAGAREEIRLAEQELERWEAAFDRNGGEDPDEYRAEIRLAEARLRSAWIGEERCRLADRLPG
jgi:hypothetical protein